MKFAILPRLPDRIICCNTVVYKQFNNRNIMKKIKLPLVLSATLLAAILGATVYYFFIREDTASKTCTTYDNQVAEQCIEDYIGLAKEEAIARAKYYGYDPVIVSVDGVNQVVTAAAVGKAPIYLIINNGVVTDAYFKGGGPTL